MVAWIGTATRETECGTVWVLLKTELTDLADGFMSSKQSRVWERGWG